MKFHRATLTGDEFLALAEKQKRGEATVYSWAVSKTNNALWEVSWSERELSIDKQRGFASVVTINNEPRKP